VGCRILHQIKEAVAKCRGKRWFLGKTPKKKKKKTGRWVIAKKRPVNLQWEQGARTKKKDKVVEYQHSGATKSGREDLEKNLGEKRPTKLVR